MTQKKRAVTEQDFRYPEFRDQNPDDYEFNADGKPVRKDRWKTAIEHIRVIVGVDDRTYEISEVIEAVQKLEHEFGGWEGLDIPEDMPPFGIDVDVILYDRSVLRGAEYRKDTKFYWNGIELPNVAGWRVARSQEEVQSE